MSDTPSDADARSDDPRPANRAERLTGFLYRRAPWLIVGAVVIAIAVGSMARNVRIDNSLQVWFLEGDPALVAYDKYKQEFGNDETIVIAVTDPDGVYTPRALERIRAASKRLDEHPDVRRVTSITMGLDVSGEEGVIDIDYLLGDGPVSPEEAARVRDRVAANPIFRGTIVSDKSDKIALILVDPKNLPDFERERPRLLSEVHHIVDQELRKDGGDAHLGGIGVVYEGLNAASLRDTSVFVTLSYLVVLAGLWLLFRRLIWVGVGVVAVSLATLATMGVAGAAGRDMNMVMAALPTLIMTIGILDLVHLIDAFEHDYARDPTASRRRILITSMGVVIVPCIVNTVTDIFGFLSLTSARMSAIRDLGWLAGVGLALLLCMTLILSVPAIARWGGKSRRAAARADRSSGLTQRVVMALFRVARDRRRTVFAVTLAAVAIAGFGISRIDVDTYTIGFLSHDNPVRRDHDIIEKEFGDYVPVELTVHTPVDNGLKNPEMLRTLDRIERLCEQDGRISHFTGLPEVIKRVNQIWNGDAPEAYAVPDSQAMVAELLLNYGFSIDGRDHLDDLVTPDYQLTHITGRTGLPTARSIEKTVHDLEHIGRAELARVDTHVEAGPAGAASAPEAEIAAAGYLPLYVRIIRHITEAQVTSFGFAFLLVAVVLMILLRSFRLGLLAMIPNLLPAIMTLGFMGLVGIRLDVATVVIASIAIGISVNDTTHIMFRFKHELHQHAGDPAAAAERMMLVTGRPVVATSLILMAGFAVLLFASVKSVSYFGLLSAATVGSALLADLILTPALLMSLWPRRSTDRTGP